ncbi:DeoR/GlpR family DNA-binding transcription regulator [Micromonospora sp. LOL_021]|uniref:DeoR/GlpR family DNA-binding transcription regulator n=1 Tax=Micromonospora sp. LOL_021 TaxID=3345417 RepID=UPI003A83A6BC
MTEDRFSCVAGECVGQGLRGGAVDQRLSLQEKEKIAALAAALVEDSSTIMINSGTTTLAVARNLGEHRDLTVATNNLLVPGALPPTVIGDIGVGAVDAEAGCTTSNLAEAAMMQEMISRAGRVAILADSSKFGRRLFAQVSELSSADYLITDTLPPAELREALAANEVKVITPPASSRQRGARNAVCRAQSPLTNGCPAGARRAVGPSPHLRRHPFRTKESLHDRGLGAPFRLQPGQRGTALGADLELLARRQGQLRGRPGCRR